MFVLAYVPWLWFNVMNKRLVAVTNGNIKDINLLPSKREILIKQYKLHDKE